MKKITLAILTTLFIGSSAQAQLLQIEKTNGDLLELDINDIKEMRFKEAQSFDGNTPENLEIIDMGLSVNWASLNIGAENPEEVGYYVSWGGIEPKDWYSWSYYEFGHSQSSLDKYTSSDDLETLQPEDDLATVSWGSEWRMPTSAEFEELLANTTVDYTAVENGVTGVRLTSTVPGYEDATLFFPVSGWKQDGNTLNLEMLCSYWASSVVTIFPQFAFAAEFWLSGDYASEVHLNGTYRYLGHPVRAVTEKK